MNQHMGANTRDSVGLIDTPLQRGGRMALRVPNRFNSEIARELNTRRLSVFNGFPVLPQTVEFEIVLARRLQCRDSAG